MKRLVGVGMVALAIMVFAVPAGATQVVDASLTGALSMTTEPSATVSGWSLAATGPNTTSGGSMVINANQPYLVTVTADKSRMTEYVTASSAYDTSDPKALTTAMTVSASRTGGTAVVAGAGVAAVIGTSTTLATGTGLGTDAYSVTLSQPTVITDSALPSGRTYHIELTYTLQSAL